MEKRYTIYNYDNGAFRERGIVRLEHIKTNEEAENIMLELHAHMLESEGSIREREQVSSYKDQLGEFHTFITGGNHKPLYNQLKAKSNKLGRDIILYKRDGSRFISAEIERIF